MPGLCRCRHSLFDIPWPADYLPPPPQRTAAGRVSPRLTFSPLELQLCDPVNPGLFFVCSVKSCCVCKESSDGRVSALI